MYMYMYNVPDLHHGPTALLTWPFCKDNHTDSSNTALAQPAVSVGLWI